MAKWIAAVLAVSILVVAGLYLSGLRVSLDGGSIPRFLTTSPDYEALEADRARQRLGVLTDKERAGTVRQGLTRVRERLGPPGASRRAAESILRLVRASRNTHDRR